MKTITALFFILFLVPVSNTHGQIVDNFNMLFLNQKQSILLPNFNTTSLLDSSIENIVLSLYVLDIKSDNEFPEVHLTINSFDPNTKQVDDGLSRILKPKKNEYSDFILPRELFEKTISTNKRFLVKMVDTNVSLVFAGLNNSVTDPRLMIVHNKEAHQEPNSSIVVNNNYSYQNISNSQINVGDGVINTNNSQENFWDKLFWYLAIPILTGLILFYIFKVR